MAAAPAENAFNVVVAYDGSEHAEHALEWYKQNLHRANHHVTLVHVPELNEMLHSTKWANSVYVFNREMLEGMLQDEQDRIRKELTKFAEKLKALGLGGKVKSVAAAKPGEGIMKECQDLDAKLVVVGSRGLGALRRTVMGSVGDYLVHHSTCPVVIVKHPKHFHLHGAHPPQEKK